MDKLGELLITSMRKEGSAAIEKVNQAMRTWVETEIIDESILRKIFIESNENPVPVTGGLGYPFTKLSPDVNGVTVTGEFPSIRPRIVRQTVVPAVLIKVINSHLADLDELRAVTDMKQWIRDKVVDEINYKENVLLLTTCHASDGSPTSISTTGGEFIPEAFPTIKSLLSTVNLRAKSIVLKESYYEDISAWDNTLASDSTLDSIKNSGESAITSFAGLDIIPVQDRIFTAAGSSAAGYVLSDKKYVGFVLNGTPLSVEIEKQKNMSLIFNAGESLGISVVNTDGIQAFSITAAS